MSGISLWPHQEKVFNLLAEGRNVILQAPTGSGKTRAALYPFLVAKDFQSDLHHSFPQKCIYSVPMRVLAKQFLAEYENAVAHYNRQYGLDISVAIQTGDQAWDSKLTSDLIFATIDQTLSSFLLAPYSLSRNQANLNAAAVMGSYLVFDEFHLYDPESTLPTTLHMLMMLKGITPFILMTATFSADMLDALANMLGAMVVPGTQQERQALQELESQQKERHYHVVDDETRPLSAQSVLEVHQGRSLVICNTIDRARRIHKELFKATQDSDTRVVLLHSRFLRKDRDAIEDEIRRLFGKGSSKDGSLIVVSTQAIEVGVDITCSRLHTELAPANAILQRAGRCARYQGDVGDVFIYRYSQKDSPGEAIDLLDDVMPYKSQKDQFEATLCEFMGHNGQALDFALEQEIVSAVHGPRDRQIINSLQVSHYDHRRRMFWVMSGDDRTDTRNLIRDIQQQYVTVHANPEEILEAPFDVPSFGLHPGTMQKCVKAWLEKAAELGIDKPVQYLKRLDGEAYEYAVQAHLPVYRWERVDTPDTVLGAPLVVVHPQLATYDPRLGFLPDQGGTWQASPPPPGEQRARDQHCYRLETYERHIQLVYQAAFEGRDAVWNEVAWLARRLEQRFEWELGRVRRAAELAVLLHDVGKLSVKWQKWVREYQQQIGHPVETGRAYAHTDFDPDRHRDIEKRMPKRPWHAVESAIATVPVLQQEFGNQHPLTFATFGAIARHHAADSGSNQAFRLVADAAAHVFSVGEWGEARELEGIDNEVPAEAGAKDIIPAPMNSQEAFWAYLLLVRLLRRADQTGTERGSLP